MCWDLKHMGIPKWLTSITVLPLSLYTAPIPQKHVLPAHSVPPRRGSSQLRAQNHVYKHLHSTSNQFGLDKPPFCYALPAGFHGNLVLPPSSVSIKYVVLGGFLNQAENLGSC